MAVAPRAESDTAVLDRVDIKKPATKKPWNLLLYNDDHHTFDEVIFQLQKAIGCSLEVAGHIAFVAHNEGKAVALTGERERCDQAAGILRQIMLIVAVVRAE
ncbi:MAG: ATP-dependent Clp protease adaptor ClpS [Planctomycetota bacterium]